MLLSATTFGYESNIVTVEVDLRKGIPSVDIVGLSDSQVKETRERVKCAILNSSLEFPSERVLVSLAPCDLRKEGTGFELSIALAILKEQDRQKGKMSEFERKDVIAIGELELTGNLRPVRSIYSIISTNKESVKYYIIPKRYEGVIEGIEGIKVFYAENLREAYESLYDLSKFIETGGNYQKQDTEEIEGILFPTLSEEERYFEIDEGLESVIDIMTVALSGKLPLMFSGSPGCQKTRIMTKAIKFLPFLTEEESQSVKRILSLSGLDGKKEEKHILPPFRMPHQTATIEGICGGGINLNPGEISLAHNGILFLDEAAEFRSSVLQMLRVPLESHSITLSRAGRSTVFPANFQLFLATNPCPCGNYGSKDKNCLCSSHSIEQYWRKFSGPLLSRIAVYVDFNDFTLTGKTIRIDIEEKRKIIAKAFKKQRERGCYNEYLMPIEIEDKCYISNEAISDEINKWQTKTQANLRQVQNLLKIARTIADINAHEEIDCTDVAKAITMCCTKTVI